MPDINSQQFREWWEKFKSENSYPLSDTEAKMIGKDYTPIKPGIVIKIDVDCTLPTKRRNWVKDLGL